MDDLDIETVNLRTGHSSPHLSDGNMQGAKSQAAEDRVRGHSRSRILRSALVSLMVLGGVLVVFLRTLSLLPSVSTKEANDSSTRIIYFTHSVPWGVLTIDGHQHSDISDLSFVSSSVGKHELEYQAAPFPVLRCLIHTPAMAIDTCPVYHPTRGDPHFGESRRVIDLGATLRKIPPTQKTSFFVAAQSALNAAMVRIQVLPGEHYVTPDRRVILAERPITATLKYEVAQNFDAYGSQSFGNESCQQSCASSDQQEHDWFVNIPVFLQWSYILPTGARVIMPLSSLTAKLVPVSTSFYVHWTGAWKIALPEDPTMAPNATLCALAESGASNLVNSILTSGEGMRISSTPTQTAPDGCLAIITLTAESSKEIQAQLLFRFGTFFAANADAHLLFPALPVASKQDAMLVNSLLQSP